MPRPLLKGMSKESAWLAPFSWEMVVAQNAVLCAAKNALHKPTSDGYEAAKEQWESFHCRSTTLFDAIDFLRRCHRAAPFCFYNGNTFASIAVVVVNHLDLDATETAVVRSLACHIVAGVAGDEEVEALREFSESLA